MQSDIIGLQSFGDIQSQSKSTMSFDYDYTVPAVEVVQPLKQAPQPTDLFNAKSHAILDDAAMSDVTSNANTTTTGDEGLLHDLEWLSLLDRSVYLDAGALRLRCLIGRGAFGVVYSADYKGQPVAVKMVKLSRANLKHDAQQQHQSTSDVAMDTPYAFSCSLGDSALLQSLPAHIQPLSQLIQEILVLNYLRSVQVPGAPNHVVEFIGCTYSHDTLMLVTKLCAYGSVESCLVAKSTAPPANPHKIPRPLPAVSPLSYSPSLALQIRILFHAALALHQVHSAKVVHHDIAARNLLLDNQWNCFLADYGLAHYQMQAGGAIAGENEADNNGTMMQTQAQKKHDLTMLRAVSEPMNVDSEASANNEAAAKSLPNSLSSLRALRLLPRASPVSELVSVRHASPESIRGVVGSHSYASDIWSFAITAWEVLMGAVPYSDLHNFQVGYRVVEEHYRLPLNSAWPSDLQNLLQACWSTLPESRPTSTDLTKMLEKIMNQAAADPKLRGGSVENPFAIPTRNETLEAAMGITRKPSIAKKKSLVKQKSIGAAAIPKVVSVIDAYDRPITPTEHFDVPEDTYMQTDPSPPPPPPVAAGTMGPPRPVLKKSALLAPSRVRPTPVAAIAKPPVLPMGSKDEGPALSGTVKLKEKEQERKELVVRADQDLLDPFADFAPPAKPQQIQQQQQQQLQQQLQHQLQQQQQQKQEEQVFHRQVATDQLDMFNSFIAASTPVGSPVAAPAQQPKPVSSELDTLFNLPTITPEKVSNLFDMQMAQPMYPQPIMPQSSIIPQPLAPQPFQPMPAASTTTEATAPVGGVSLDLLGFASSAAATAGVTVSYDSPRSKSRTLGGPALMPSNGAIAAPVMRPAMPMPLAPMSYGIPPPAPPSANLISFGAAPPPPGAPPAAPMPAAAPMLNFPAIQNAYGGLPAQSPAAPPAAAAAASASRARHRSSRAEPTRGLTADAIKSMPSVHKPSSSLRENERADRKDSRDRTEVNAAERSDLSDLSRKSELLSKPSAVFSRQAKGPATSFSLFSQTPTSSSSSSSSYAAPSSDKQRARSRSGSREDAIDRRGAASSRDRDSRDQSRSQFYDRSSDRGGADGGGGIGAGYGVGGRGGGGARSGSAGGRGGRGGGAVARSKVAYDSNLGSPSDTSMDWRFSSSASSSSLSSSASISSTMSAPKDKDAAAATIASPKKKSFTQTMTDFFSNAFSRNKKSSESAPAPAAAATSFSTGSAISNAPARAPAARAPGSIAQHAAAVAATAAAAPSKAVVTPRRRVSVTDSLAVEKAASKRKSKKTATTATSSSTLASKIKGAAPATGTRGNPKAGMTLAGKKMERSDSASSDHSSSDHDDEEEAVEEDEEDDDELRAELGEMEGGMIDEEGVVADSKQAFKKRKRAPLESKKIQDVDLLSFDDDEAMPAPVLVQEAEEDLFDSFSGENEAVNAFAQQQPSESRREQKPEMADDFFPVELQEVLGSTMDESPFQLVQDIRKNLKPSTNANTAAASSVSSSPPTILLSQLRNVRHFNSDVFEGEMNISGTMVPVFGRAFPDSEEYLSLKLAASSINAKTNRILPVAGFVDAVEEVEDAEEEDSQQPNYILMRKELFVSPASGTSSTLQAAFNLSFPTSSSNATNSNPAFPDSDRLRWLVSAWKQYASAISQLQSLQISFGAGGALQIPANETTARMIEQPDLHLPLSPQLLLFPSSHPHLFDQSATYTSEELLARSQEISARYLAPELIRGSLAQGADEKAEVWSMAVTIWELVTGLVAYENQAGGSGGGINALLLRIATGAARLQIQGQVSLSALPESFQNLLAQCLEINPANRPTLAQLLQGLERMKV